MNSPLKILLYAVLGLTFALLALTGFTGPLSTAHAVSGWALLLHAALAPAFSLVAAAWAVIYAPRHAFNENDWIWLERNDRMEDAASGLAFGRKVCFWLILTMAVPAILSISLNMFPLFSTDQQSWLLTVHYASVTVISLGLFGYAGCSWAQMDTERAFG